MAKNLLTLEQKYQFLLKKVKEELVAALKAGQCSEMDVLTFLYIFQNVSNYWELRGMIDVYAEKFVFLKRINAAVREVQKSDVENFLVKKMPELIQTNPEMVEEISRFVNNPEVTLMTLLEKYKEILK